MDKSISICFTTTTGPISRIIRWFIKSDVSHCAITYFDEELGLHMVMEADWSGFVVVPWNQWKKKNKIIERYILHPYDKNLVLKAISNLSRFVGTKYDFKSILPLALRRVLKSFKNPWMRKDRLFCSESIILFLNDLGITNIERPNDYTPDDVWKLIKLADDVFKLYDGDE